MGRHVFAIGGNPEASRFSGLPLGRIQIGVFVSGLTAGIAAFMGASFYGSASCVDATGYELYVIASAVVGGASLSGGKGSAVGAMLGALLIVLIRQSIRTLHFDQNYEWIIIGCAIIVAVVLDQANARLTGARGARGGRTAEPARCVTQTGDDARWRCRRDEAIARGAALRLVPLRRAAACGRAGRRISRGAARRRGDAGIKIAMIAKSLDQPGVPLGAHRRRGGGEGAVAEARRADRDRLADAAGRGRPGAGAADRAGGQRGRDAALISCSDAGKVTGAINDAVARGVPVMTFDSDAPESKRFAFYGVDDIKTGQAVMDELAKQMGEKGKRRDPRRQPERAEPAQARRGREGGGEEASGHQDRRHLLSHRDAAGRRRRSDPRAERVSADPGLGDDRRLAAVHADAADRSRSEEGEDRRRRRAARGARLRRQGLAPVLLAQPTYLWGYVSVRRIVDKVHLKQDVPAIIPMELVRVSKENLGTWARPAEGVGLHRRAGGVSEDAVEAGQLQPADDAGRWKDSPPKL